MTGEGACPCPTVVESPASVHLLTDHQPAQALGPAHVTSFIVGGNTMSESSKHHGLQTCGRPSQQPEGACVVRHVSGAI